MPHCLAVLRLVAENRLSLDASIGRYLPEAAAAVEGVTPAACPMTSLRGLD